MIGNARQRGIGTAARRLAREHDAEHLARGDGVFAECLVEVAHAIEQDGVRILGFDLVILAQQRGFFGIFLSHTLQKYQLIRS